MNLISYMYILLESSCYSLLWYAKFYLIIEINQINSLIMLYLNIDYQVIK